MELWWLACLHHILLVFCQIFSVFQTKDELFSVKAWSSLFQCESPNIIGFYGAFFIENRISICTEFMDGNVLNCFILMCNQ